MAHVDDCENCQRVLAGPFGQLSEYEQVLAIVLELRRRELAGDAEAAEELEKMTPALRVLCGLRDN